MVHVQVQEHNKKDSPRGQIEEHLWKASEVECYNSVDCNIQKAPMQLTPTKFAGESCITHQSQGKSGQRFEDENVLGEFPVATQVNNQVQVRKGKHIQDEVKGSSIDDAWNRRNAHTVRCILSCMQRGGYDL